MPELNNQPNTVIREAMAADAECISALPVYLFLDTYAADGIRPDLASEKGIELALFYVHPKFHRKGVGVKLLKAAEQQGCREGANLIWLTAWTGNSNVIGFYKHYGHRDKGKTEHIIDGIFHENRFFSKNIE